MAQVPISWITEFIWRIADDVLRDLYVRGKYRDVILTDRSVTLASIIMPWVRSSKS